MCIRDRAEAEVKREVEPVAGIEDRAEAEIEDKTEVRTKAETDTECRHGVKRCVTCRSRRLIYEWQEHTSAAAARNRGIRRAVGDLVILLDSDIVTLPDFIEAHVFARLDPCLLYTSTVVKHRVRESNARQESQG